jgi:putative membrane protein
VDQGDRVERTAYRTSRFGSGMEVETHLSWLQSRMSAERTLMSLVRFATTMIGLGFTVVEYLAHPGGADAAGSAVRTEAVRFFGLGTIGAGVGLLLVALSHYRVSIAFLWSSDYRPLAGIGDDRRTTWATVAVAVLLVLVGIAALGAVLLRLG